MDVTYEILRRAQKGLSLGIRLFLPHLCMLCRLRAWGALPVCLGCVRELRKSRWQGWVPEDHRMAAAAPPTWSVYRMEGAVGPLIHALKYQDYAQSAPYMVQQFLAWDGAIAQKELASDWVIPVPLHKARMRERGFNQSARLGLILAKRWGLNYPEKPILRRLRNTTTQTQLGEKARRQNIQSSISCSNPALIQGRSVLLVDDVTTTGSTLAACASCLLEAGAHDVKALVWAWVPKGNPEKGSPV